MRLVPLKRTKVKIIRLYKDIKNDFVQTIYANITWLFKKTF